MTDLSDLEARYFGPAQIYREDTEIEFLIDGSRYLAALDAEIRATAAGDRIYLVDWFFDPTLELGGRKAGAADYLEVGDLLAAKQHAGVDVRVVLNGAQYSSRVATIPFGVTWSAYTDLQARVPAGATTPPLAKRVLYDWSGADRTGSHHQKSALVMRGGVLTAFVAGIDVNALMQDDRPHNRRSIGPPPGVPWGWHDGGVRLRGAATAGVYQNFAHRWEEAGTLPPSTLWIKPLAGPAVRVVVDPGVVAGVPALAPQSTATPTAAAAVQVLRSRWPTKLNRPGAARKPWLTAGGGGLYEVYLTLSEAIRSAQRYIYIEDQFLGDHPAMPAWVPDLAAEGFWTDFDILVDPRVRALSLFPLLKAAAQRNVKIIMVGSGYADPGDQFKGEKNTELTIELKRLAAGNEDQVAVWRMLQETVHAKLMIIDDEFAAVGSANLQARSMYGVDSELHVAVVSAGSTVRDFRVRLWAEHLNVDYATAPQALRDSFDDPGFAVGMWRKLWGNGVDWFTAGHPAGFTPATLGAAPRTDIVRAYVGPGGSP